MSRILVPLDESELAEQALPWAQLLAKSLGSSIHLISVWNADHDSFKRAGIDPSESIPRIRDEVQAYLNEVAARPVLAGIDVTTEVRLGDAAEQISDIAADDTTMIVVSSHGRGGFKRTLRGSVADEIVRGLTVPVLVVTPNDHNAALTNVLVTLDGSDDAESALPIARQIAAAAGVTLHVLRVYNPLSTVTATFPAPQPNLGVVAEQMLDAATSYMAEVVKDGEVSEVLAGRPLDVIIGYAEDHSCELIVMASHGRGGVVRLALGSTADAVSRHAASPVLIVPCHDGDDEEEPVNHE